MSIYNVKTTRIPDEINQEIINNTINFPIGKAFLEEYKSWYDIINTYDDAMENIDGIISSDSILDENIEISENNFLNIIVRFINTKIYSPNSVEAELGYLPVTTDPNIALAKRMSYTATIIADCEVTISQFRTNDLENYSKQQLSKFIIEKGYAFNFPIPIYSKYCSLRDFDKLTLIKSGNEMESLYGYFIIEGYMRFLLPLQRKPFNSPIVLKNDYENQLSRTEVLFTKGFDYENSYYVIASMVQEKQSNVGRSGAIHSPPDFIFSLQLNDKTMKTEANFTGKRSQRKLINIVPIKYLFYAFGCTSDEEILRYICPEMNNYALMHCVRNACLQGYKHRKAIEDAMIPCKHDVNYILPDYPLTRETALYIIGVAILNDETKNKLLERFNNETEYRKNIALLVEEILETRFMPAVGTITDIDRNKAVCIEMGLIINKLYLVGYNLEPSQDKASLTNRRIRIGPQIEREFKSFHNVRIREMIEELKKIVNDTKDVKNIIEKIKNEMNVICKKISKNMTFSMINSFKQSTKEQSKLRTNLITPKNQTFLNENLRDVVITPSSSQQNSEVSWVHRDVHQSELFFIDPTATPEAGSQTGRFKTPSIYTFTTIAGTAEKEVNFITNHKNYIKNVYD